MGKETRPVSTTRSSQVTKILSPSSQTCAFETAEDRFFRSINLYPSLSAVLEHTSSSELSREIFSLSRLNFFLEEPMGSCESESDS